MICLTDFRQGDLSPPSVSNPKKVHRVKAAAFLDNNWKFFFSSLLVPFSTKVCSDVPLKATERKRRKPSILEHVKKMFRIYLRINKN